MNAPSKPIRVVLADDHNLILNGIKLTLIENGFDVVGEASMPAQAVALYREYKPDVLLLDIRFNEAMSGMDAAKEVLQEFPAANIVFLSQFDQISMISEAYRLGARGYIPKGCATEDLLRAVTEAAQGKEYLMGEVARRLAQVAIKGEASPQSVLDARELQIFVALAKGHTNAEIASDLDLSVKTISNTA